MRYYFYSKTGKPGVFTKLGCKGKVPFPCCIRDVTREGTIEGIE
jgi:hypothetical protein